MPTNQRLSPLPSVKAIGMGFVSSTIAFASSSESKISEHGELAPDKRGKNFPFCGILSGDPDVEVHEQVAGTGCYDVGVPKVDGIYELRICKEREVDHRVQHLWTPRFLKSGLGTVGGG